MPISSYADTPAADTPVPAETIKPEIRTILIAAKALYDAKNIADALAKIAETDAIANKTPYEIFAIEKTRGDYYFASGDKAKAAKAFEAVIDSKSLRRADQLSMTQAVGQLYFQLSNYPLTITWIQRYITEGGTDPKAQDVLNKAHFLNKDYADAYKGFGA